MIKLITSMKEQEKLIMENITKTYKKATNKLEKAINKEVKNIAKSNKLAERIITYQNQRRS